jgi:RND family efflux transporter MFP subunit
MNWYNKMKLWLGRKAVRGALLLVLIAIGAFMALNNRDSAPEEMTEEQLPVVTVTTAQQFAGGSTINLIGTVRAFSEAAITTEAAGRVTGVRVALGDTVAAGSIIATLENASQNASVLSAQGSYEAALASAAQSNVSIGTAQNNLAAAQNNALSAYQGAYNTANGVVLNTVDLFYRNPTGIYPSLNISSQGNAEALREARTNLNSVLEVWRIKANTTDVNVELETKLAEAETDIASVISIVDLLTNSVSRADKNDKLNGQPVSSFSAQLIAARGSLTTLANSLQNAQTSIDNSTRALAQAELAAAGSTNSAADAQVKQALGSLRSAQASLAKTIIRTPISGTVNSLNIRTGDFINSFAQVAEVANNNALEVVTFAGEKDREVITVGDTVMIEDRITGTVTEVAPAVDSATGKTEVRIASESKDLQNGDSVQITKTVEGSATTDVIIPLSAIKFALSDGSVFLVENNLLVPRLVELGVVRGGSVEIISGLSVDEQFVVDARGLVESTEVEVIR